jgi:hypothetical protein
MTKKTMIKAATFSKAEIRVRLMNEVLMARFPLVLVHLKVPIGDLQVDKCLAVHFLGPHSSQVQEDEAQGDYGDDDGQGDPMSEVKRFEYLCIGKPTDESS